MCAARLQASENARPHVSHAWGLTPVWVGMCLVRLLACENLGPNRGLPLVQLERGTTNVRVCS